MKTLLALFAFIPQLLHIHDWYHGDYSLGVRSKYTDDLIGRYERRCMTCSCKQLSISQLSSNNKNKVQKILGKKKFYDYKDGDWLDSFTRSVLTINVVDRTVPFSPIETIPKPIDQYKLID